MAAITTCFAFMLFAAEELDAILRQTGIPSLETSPSQGPDLNRSVVDLQSTAWPLRHLGDRVDKYPILFVKDTI